MATIIPNTYPHARVHVPWRFWAWTHQVDGEGNLNPQLLAFGRRMYDIQSRVLRIPDRIGPFSRTDDGDSDESVVARRRLVHEVWGLDLCAKLTVFGWLFYLSMIILFVMVIGPIADSAVFVFCVLLGWTLFMLALAWVSMACNPCREKNHIWYDLKNHQC